MRVAYVSGPYSNESMWSVYQNIEMARIVARDLWSNGYAVICPHGNTAFMDGNDMSWKEWIAGDLEIIKRCDTVFMLPNWRTSKGAVAEYECAVENGKVIIFVEMPDMYKITNDGIRYKSKE